MLPPPKTDDAFLQEVLTGSLERGEEHDEDLFKVYAKKGEQWRESLEAELTTGFHPGNALVIGEEEEEEESEPEEGSQEDESESDKGPSSEESEAELELAKKNVKRMKARLEKVMAG